MPPRLLVLTIGQSPRDDIATELGAVLGERPLDVCGALDSLTHDEIAALTPTGDDDTLHTRLPGGIDVVVSKAAVTERLGRLLEQAAGRPTLVACTGRFAGLPAVPNVLYPSVVLEGLVDAVLPPARALGVLVPLEAQIAPFTRTWSRPDRLATVASVLPGDDPTAAADLLAAADVDLVILDCFGYDRSTLDRVRERTGRPVLSRGALLRPHRWGTSRVRRTLTSGAVAPP